MLHQSSTVIIRAGSCWLFLLLGWAELLLLTAALGEVLCTHVSCMASVMTIAHNPPKRPHPAEYFL
jgi:hypothetical protein